MGRTTTAGRTGERGCSGRRLFVAVAVVLFVATCGCASERVRLGRGVVSVDGTRIAVHDNCHTDPRLDVTETDTVVEIEFTVAAKTGGDCFSCTVATLEAELGDRTVVEAGTAAVLPTTGDCFTGPDP